MYIEKLLFDKSFELKNRRKVGNLGSVRHGIKTDEKRKLKLKISNAFPSKIARPEMQSSVCG